MMNPALESYGVGFEDEDDDNVPAELLPSVIGDANIESHRIEVGTSNVPHINVSSFADDVDDLATGDFADGPKYYKWPQRSLWLPDSHLPYIFAGNLDSQCKRKRVATRLPSTTGHLPTISAEEAMTPVPPRPKRRRLRGKSKVDDPSKYTSHVLPLKDADVDKWDGAAPLPPLTAQDRNEMWTYIFRKYQAEIVPNAAYYQSEKTSKIQKEKVWQAYRDKSRDDMKQMCWQQKERYFTRWVQTDKPGPRMAGFLRHNIEQLRKKAKKNGSVFWVRKSGMYTWINSDWVLKSVMVESRDWSVVEEACRSSEEVLSLQKEFQHFIDAHLMPFLKYPQYRCGMEICPETFLETGELQVHFHVYWYHTRKDPKFRASLDSADVQFKGQHPKVPDLCMCSNDKDEPDDPPELLELHKRSEEKIRSNGLLYVSAPKIGHLYDWGNVELKWSSIHPNLITKIFAEGKMTAIHARKCYLNCVVNCQHNITSLEYVIQNRMEDACVAYMNKVKENLAKKKFPRKYIDVVEETWLPSLLDKDLGRRKFLVLDGPSKVGKTEYARALADGDEYFFQADCSGQEHPNVKGLSWWRHRIALFDECSVKVVLKNKRLFQGSHYGGSVGNSSTNMYQQTVNTWGVGIIVATNNWAYEISKQRPDDIEWLWSNCYYVNEQDKLYVEPEGERTFSMWNL